MYDAISDGRNLAMYDATVLVVISGEYIVHATQIAFALTFTLANVNSLSNWRDASLSISSCAVYGLSSKHLPVLFQIIQLPLKDASKRCLPLKDVCRENEEVGAK